MLHEFLGFVTIAQAQGGDYQLKQFIKKILPARGDSHYHQG
jgi:hypothetical protein